MLTPRPEREQLCDSSCAGAIFDSSHIAQLIPAGTASSAAGRGIQRSVIIGWLPSPRGEMSGKAPSGRRELTTKLCAISCPVLPRSQFSVTIDPAACTCGSQHQLTNVKYEQEPM